MNRLKYHQSFITLFFIKNLFSNWKNHLYLLPLKWEFFKCSSRNATRMIIVFFIYHWSKLKILFDKFYTRRKIVKIIVLEQMSNLFKLLE